MEFPIIVTGVSSNHFNESKSMISTAQRYLNAKIYLYDLGLKAQEINEIKKYCNVTVIT